MKFNYDLAKSSKQWMIKYNKNTTSSNHKRWITFEVFKKYPNLSQNFFARKTKRASNLFCVTFVLIRTKRRFRLRNCVRVTTHTNCYVVMGNYNVKTLPRNGIYILNTIIVRKLAKCHCFYKTDSSFADTFPAPCWSRCFQI